MSAAFCVSDHQTLVIDLIEQAFFPSHYDTVDDCVLFCNRYHKPKKSNKQNVCLSVDTWSFAAVAISLSIFVDRRALYCTHKDLFGTWLDPSKYCIAQGIHDLSIIQNVTKIMDPIVDGQQELF